MNQPQGKIALQSNGFFSRNTAVVADIAWIKWYSTLVPSRTPPPYASAPADLANWEFTSGALTNLETDNSGVTLSLSSPSYTQTPTYPPKCNAGNQTSFRAGFPAQLDGTASSSGDESPLSYFWQQVATPYANLPDIRPQHLRWSSHTAAQPLITGLVFGPIDFQLTVTQGDGRSTSCIVQDGAVATDNNGTVLTATGNLSLDNAIGGLIGPMVQFGRNPWPFYDQSAYWAATNRIADMDVVGDYFDYWDVPATGTVSVTLGANMITGTGTHFMSDVCNAAGTPNSPGYIILWYLTGRTFNGVAETGRVRLYLSSCSDDTHATIHSSTTCCGMTVWGGSGTLWPDQGSAQLSYTIPANYGTWDENSPAPANFYDTVQSYYALYYRSGIDTFLYAARKFADRFWTCTQLDRGMAYTPGGIAFSGPGRANSLSGLVLRALDTADGHADMWHGIHFIIQYNSHYNLVTSWPYYIIHNNSESLDPRETGYELAQEAYEALYDPSTTIDAPGGITWQQYARNDIATTFSNTPGTGLFPVAMDPNQRAWVSWTGNRSSFDTGSPNPAWYQSTVDLVNGSTLVSCHAGANCGFAPTDFYRYNNGTGNYTPCSSGFSCASLPVLFFGYDQGSGSFLAKPWAQPFSSNQTDNQVYCYPNPCTYVDSNHFTLDRPYAGVTGQHGWDMVVYSKLNTIAVTNGGANYSSSPTIGITDSAGSGTGATASAVVSGGVITAINVTNAGKGYVAPVVSISDVSGGGAAAIATIIAQGDNSNTGQVGYGTASYMEGILTWALGLAGMAMDCGTANPPGCNNAIRDEANGDAILGGEWMMNYGIIPYPVSGSAYFGGFPACSSPATAANVVCTHGESTIQQRELQGDGYRGLATALQLETNSATKAAMVAAEDEWYAGMWAKPQVGNPPVPSPDGTWETGFDATGCYVNAVWQISAHSTFTNCPGGQGYWITTTVDEQNKFNGQMFGISDQASWPVLRIGGTLPSNPTTIYVSGRLGDVSGAAQMQVTVTEPTGIADPPTVCSSSPCAVSVDRMMGNPMLQVSYLSAGGRVLATGEAFVVSLN